MGSCQEDQVLTSLQHSALQRALQRALQQTMAAVEDQSADLCTQCAAKLQRRHTTTMAAVSEDQELTDSSAHSALQKKTLQGGVTMMAAVSEDQRWVLHL
jgi:hypothetical protein